MVTGGKEGRIRTGGELEMRGLMTFPHKVKLYEQIIPCN